MDFGNAARGTPLPPPNYLINKCLKFGYPKVRKPGITCQALLTLVIRSLTCYLLGLIHWHPADVPPAKDRYILRLLAPVTLKLNFESRSFQPQ